MLTSEIRIKGTANREKLICIYRKSKNSNEKVCCSVDGQFRMSKAEFELIRERPMSAKYMMIKFDTKLKNLKEHYNAVIESADALKKHTKGEINLYKTGGYPKTSLSYFFLKTDLKQLPPDITQEEGEFLENASMSAMIFCNKYDGPAYKYDICSMYPSIMCSPHMSFPCGVGELKTYTKAEFNKRSYHHYGIYRCTIDIKNTRLMKVNDDGYYTHIDLTRAQELGYKIDICEDDEPNAIVYSKSLTNGYKIFNEFVEPLFELKKKGITGAKCVLNTLWGSLCRRSEKKTLDTNYFPEINEKAEAIFCPSNFDDDNTLVNYFDVGKEYEYEYSLARMKPFLLAKGRYIISKLIEKNIENIVFCHTDGIILTKPITLSKNMIIGAELGNLKDEGYDPNCVIKSCTDYKFD